MKNVLSKNGLITVWDVFGIWKFKKKFSYSNVRRNLKFGLFLERWWRVMNEAMRNILFRYMVNHLLLHRHFSYPFSLLTVYEMNLSQCCFLFEYEQKRVFLVSINMMCYREITPDQKHLWLKTKVIRMTSVCFTSRHPNIWIANLCTCVFQSTRYINTSM